MTLLAASYPSPRATSKKVGKNTREKVENTYTAEIIIGICAPIGSYSTPVIDELESQLKKHYNYQVIRIKLSKFIEDFIDISGDPSPGETRAYSLLKKKIDGGNKLRKDYTNYSILAELAIASIHEKRNQAFDISVGLPDPTDYVSRRVCYIVDSLKNQEELLLLRSVYRGLFYLFSIYSPLKLRKETLIQKGLSNTEVESIINTDEFENNEHGQNVRDTFTDADFFIRVGKNYRRSLSSKITRYLNLIFDCDIITPLPHEIAMYQAKSAAHNSGCLSRQVGASITDKDYNVLATGWNDVPKFGGNLYTDRDKENDHRCKIVGNCSNDLKKGQLTSSIVDIVIKSPILQKMMKKGLPPGYLDTELAPSLESLVRNSTKIKDLIEYSRAVHAEMHAIIIGSQQTGSKMAGGTLFCTTYPCHNCARHAILAGINQIYFIEPYKKSLCLTLHDDSITENEREKGKLKILLYDGVGPRRFMKFFNINRSRKQPDGTLSKVNRQNVEPKIRLSLQSIPVLEQQAIHSIAEAGLIKI